MKPTAEQLAIINGRLPGTKVTEDQVDVLPFMAFDQRQTDRYTVMTPEMMRKIELDMNEGRVAFNSLHRSQTTLPVGRSVNARIVGSELQTNMYAVHTRPDGTPFIDAKELVDKYNTGAVYACSLGVSVGLYKCSICGNDIRDWSSCDHIPGRTYQVDEKPKLCIAYMTGRNIQNGIAMDCRAYELSAVTAGGVANAGVLTQAFGKYDNVADPVEFKKSSFEAGKDLEDHVTFYAHPTEVNNEEVSTMQKDEVKALVEEYTKGIVADKAKADAAYETLKTEFDKAAEAATALQAEFEKVSGEFASLKETHKALEVEVEKFKVFQSEFIGVVEAAGTAVGESADYAAMDIETLKTTYAAYRDKLNALPVGQQSAGELADETGPSIFSAIPDNCFKS